MRRILLVTGREFRRMVTLPGFWVASLIVPIFVLVAPFAQSILGRSKTVGYVLVDRSGRYSAQINRRLELDYQRQVLVQLLVYAGEWMNAGRTSGAIPNVQASPQIGAASRDSLSDAVVEGFMSAGGATTILRALKPRLSRSAPPFQPPGRPLVEIPVPKDVNTNTADRFGASIGPHFQGSVISAAGSVGLAVAVYVPDNVDSGGQVRVWTNGPAGTALVQDVKIELTQGLRQNALHAAGVDPLSAARIESLGVPVSIAAPETPARGGGTIAHSILPLALAYLLLASMMITGSMMLQGLVEERSNKLLEAVLACVSPRELMIGKLVGISAIGLSIVGIWVSATMAIISLYPSSPLGFLLPALTSLWQTPGMAVAMVFYFLAGFLTIGMIFLDVGLMRDSMQEAQAYLMPVTLVIAVPSAMLASVIYRDPNGLIPRIFSWIPIYTPVTMLARLQGGVSLFEILGTAVVLLAFGALELFVLGRLFENNLIQAGRGFHIPAKVRRAVFVGLALILLVVGITVRRARRATQTDDQAAALRSHGESVFQAACAKCHDPAVERVPNRMQLATFAPAEIVNSLTSGTMKPMAAGLSTGDMRGKVAGYLTGRAAARYPRRRNTIPPPCPNPSAFSPSASGNAAGGWNGWSIDPRDWRLQPAPGLTVEEIPRLKVKWAFSYPGGNYGQPAVVGGRLFLTSRGGAIYSLDAKTGCLYWRFAQSTPSRTTVSVGPLPGVAPSGYAAYFGDTSAHVYAVDAASGALLLWRQRSILILAPRSLARRFSSKTVSTCRCRLMKRELHRWPVTPAAHFAAVWSR